MRASVICQDCSNHIGVYEREGVIDGSEIELQREFAICPVCESASKAIDIFDLSVVEPPPVEVVEEPPPPEPEPDPSFYQRVLNFFKGT